MRKYKRGINANKNSDNKSKLDEINLELTTRTDYESDAIWSF